MEVEWDTPSESRKYLVDVQIVSETRKGLFKEISKVCDDNELEVVGLNLDQSEPGITNALLTVELSELHQIQRLQTGLRQLDGVTKVYRPRSN